MHDLNPVRRPIDLTEAFHAFTQVLKVFGVVKRPAKRSYVFLLNNIKQCE
jgi:hypothetical protein